MPAVASLEQLREVAAEMEGLRIQFPDAYEALVSAYKRHRGVGYKNVAKIMMGEATPEKLKGIG